MKLGISHILNAHIIACVAFQIVDYCVGIREGILSLLESKISSKALETYSMGIIQMKQLILNV
jgi:hypothetical protein